MAGSAFAGHDQSGPRCPIRRHEHGLLAGKSQKSARASLIDRRFPIRKWVGGATILAADPSNKKHRGGCAANDMWARQRGNTIGTGRQDQHCEGPKPRNVVGFK